MTETACHEVCPKGLGGKKRLKGKSGGTIGMERGEGRRGVVEPASTFRNRREEKCW